MTLAKNLSLFAIVGMTAFSSTAALALDIYNQDAKPYEVKVDFNTGTTRGPLNGNTRTNWYSGSSGECDPGCKVEVNGVGRVSNVKNGDLVTIKDGVLTVEPLQNQSSSQ